MRIKFNTSTLKHTLKPHRIAKAQRMAAFEKKARTGGWVDHCPVLERGKQTTQGTPWKSCVRCSLILPFLGSRALYFVLNTHSIPQSIRLQQLMLTAWWVQSCSGSLATCLCGLSKATWVTTLQPQGGPRNPPGNKGFSKS